MKKRKSLEEKEFPDELTETQKNKLRKFFDDPGFIKENSTYIEAVLLWQKKTIEKAITAKEKISENTPRR